MKKMFAVISGSGVTKDKIYLSPKAIINAHFSISDIGAPSSLSHDIHRLVGWTHNGPLYIDHLGVKQTAVIEIADNNVELSRMKSMMLYSMNERINNRKDEKETFAKLLPSFSMLDHRIYILLNTITVYQEGIVSAIAPELFADVDKDGLVDYFKLQEIVPGVFRLNETFVVYAHSYFRRSLSIHNSLNTHFFQTLKRVSEEYKSDINIRLQIDPDLIGYNKNVLQSIEFEYWYGPKFDNDLRSIKNGVSTYNSDEKLRLFHGITQTQFQWKNGKGNKVLEIEEVIDNPSLGINDKTFGLRYVHSIVEDQSGVINHLDGAIRAYDETAYLSRIEVPIDQAGKRSVYTKLWRLDGKIPLGEWKRLILDYYRDNTLVGEYFGIAKSIEVESNKAVGQLTVSRDVNNFIPYSCKFEKDIKIAFKKRNFQQIERTKLHSLSKVIMPNGREQVYFEVDAFHFLKAMKKSEIEYSVPQGVELIICDDLYHNIPIIETTLEIFPKIVSIFADCLSAYGVNIVESILSINFIVHGEKSFQLGLYGKTSLLKSLFGVGLLFQKEKELNTWVNEISNFLLSHYSSDGVDFKLSSILNTAGFMNIERTLINNDNIKYQIDEAGVNGTVTLSEDECVSGLESGEVKIAPILGFDELICGKCKESYLTCDCNQLADKEVTLTVEGAFLISTYWTDMTASQSKS